MNKPNVIYKYEDFSTQGLRNLKSQSLYFGSPLGFNDPYDCAISPEIKELTDADILNIRETYIKDPRVPAHVKKQFAFVDINWLRHLLTEKANQMLKEVTENFLKNRGVTCFSERNDDLLMWSHITEEDTKDSA